MEDCSNMKDFKDFGVSGVDRAVRPPEANVWIAVRIPDEVWGFGIYRLGGCGSGVWSKGLGFER